MQQRSEIKAGVILSYINMGINFIMPMIYTPIMLRILGQAEYGLYQLSQSVIGYLNLLSFGMSTSIARYLMKYHAVGDMLNFQRMAGLFQTIYGIIAAAAVAIGCGLTGMTGILFARGLTQPEIQKMNVLLVIMAIGAGISFLGMVYDSIIFCHERHIFQKIVGLIGTLSLPLTNLVVLYCGFASVGLSVLGIITRAATTLINIWYCKKKLGVMPQFDHMPIHVLKEIVPFSLFVFISMVADMLFWAVDKVFIGALMGTVAVAVYNIGITFQSIMQNMNGVISSVFTPRINRIVLSGRPIAEISDLLLQVGRIQYLILSLVLSGFVVFGKDFIQLWAGPGYEEAYHVALLTMFPMTIPLIQGVAFQTVVAMNRHQFRAVMYACMAIANAASTYLLIPVMGITGAALCTCVAIVLGQGITLNWFYHKKIGLDIPGFWKNILKLTVVPGAMATICMLVGFEINDLWKLLLGAGIYACVFCVLSWRFSMNQYEKALVLGILKRLLPRKDTK